MRSRFLRSCLLNGALGYLQESRAEKALAALKKMTAPRVRVLRAGQEQEVDAKTLVPGDVVLLETRGPGARRWSLPQCRQSPGAGSSPHRGSRGGTQAAGHPDRRQKRPWAIASIWSFKAPRCCKGRGTVLVTQTGMQTELGRIAHLDSIGRNEPTPLQQRMGQLGNVLVSGSLVLVALVVVIGAAAHGRLKPV
jgi:Ca2+-transporting ATPase